jgi:hypothetical protein
MIGSLRRRLRLHDYAAPLLPTLLGSLNTDFQLDASGLRAEQGRVDVVPLLGIGALHQPDASDPAILAQRRGRRQVKERTEGQIAGKREPSCWRS